MSKSLLEMAAGLVQAQCSTKSMTNDELTASLQATFCALQSLQTNEARLQGPGADPVVEAAVAPEVTPKASIQKNKIICLECGHEGRIISAKHLKSHGLTGREYRVKWGIPLRQPLCAKALTDQRKKAGKERGLPEKLRNFVAGRKKNAAKAKKTAAVKK